MGTELYNDKIYKKLWDVNAQIDHEKAPAGYRGFF